MSVFARGAKTATGLPVPRALWSIASHLVRVRCVFRGTGDQAPGPCVHLGLPALRRRGARLQMAGIARGAKTATGRRVSCGLWLLRHDSRVRRAPRIASRHGGAAATRRALALDGAAPRLGARRRGIGRLAGAGRLRLLRGAVRDGADRPARTLGRGRGGAVLRRARPRRAAARPAGLDPADDRLARPLLRRPARSLRHHGRSAGRRDGDPVRRPARRDRPVPRRASGARDRRHGDRLGHDGHRPARRAAGRTRIVARGHAGADRVVRGLGDGRAGAAGDATTRSWCSSHTARRC